MHLFKKERIFANLFFLFSKLILKVFNSPGPPYKDLNLFKTICPLLMTKSQYHVLLEAFEPLLIRKRGISGKTNKVKVGHFRKKTRDQISNRKKEKNWNCSILGHFRKNCICRHVQNISSTNFLGHFMIPPVFRVIHLQKSTILCDPLYGWKRIVSVEKSEWPFQKPWW